MINVFIAKNREDVEGWKWDDNADIDIGKWREDKPISSIVLNIGMDIDSLNEFINAVQSVNVDEKCCRKYLVKFATEIRGKKDSNVPVCIFVHLGNDYERNRTRFNEICDESVMENNVYLFAISLGDADRSINKEWVSEMINENGGKVKILNVPTTKERIKDAIEAWFEVENVPSSLNDCLSVPEAEETESSEEPKGDQSELKPTNKQPFSQKDRHNSVMHYMYYVLFFVVIIALLSGFTVLLLECVWADEFKSKMGFAILSLVFILPLIGLLKASQKNLLKLEERQIEV